MSADQKKRLVYHVPHGLDDRLRAFAHENGFHSEREALSALIEGALDAYPRWGVKKGIARVVSSELRNVATNLLREKLVEFQNELAENMSTPPLEDQAPLLSGSGDDF